MKGKKNFILTSLACLSVFGGGVKAMQKPNNTPLSMRCADDIQDNEIFTGKQVKDLIKLATIGNGIWAVAGGLFGGTVGSGTTYYFMDKDKKYLVNRMDEKDKEISNLEKQLGDEKSKHLDYGEKDEKIKELKEEIEKLKSENQALKDDDSKCKKISELEKSNKAITGKYETEKKKVDGIGQFLFLVSGISDYECKRFVKNSGDRYKNDKDIQRLINVLKMFKIYSTYASKELINWYIEPDGEYYLAVDCQKLQNTITYNAGVGGDKIPGARSDPQTKDLWDIASEPHYRA